MRQWCLFHQALIWINLEKGDIKLMGKRNEQNIVGTRIGLYDVLYECDFKSNDGHRMFHIKCSE